MASFFKQYFCEHDWEERYKSKLYEHSFDSIPCEIKITLICKKCGKIKQITL